MLTSVVPRRGHRPANSGRRSRFSLLVIGAAVLGMVSTTPARAGAAQDERWVASWAAAQHGPYPSGIATAGPDLRFAFPVPPAGATDQTLRLIVKPDLWGHRVRLRFSNVYGDRPLRLDQVFVGIQASGGNVVPGTNRRVSFDRGAMTTTIAPGARGFSDAIELDYVARFDSLELSSRNLAVSFHVVGSTGPMTWHSGAFRTSYLGRPNSGPHSAAVDDLAFPFTTTSWFFLDAVDVMAPQETIVVAAMGDSITNGSNSTLNGDDRWANALSTRLHAALGASVSVVILGIGGNQVVGPSTYDVRKPYFGGPSALERLDRDILGLSGLTHVIWLEGINDFGQPGNLVAGLQTDAAEAIPPTPPEAVIAGLREGVTRLRSRGIKVIGGTLTPTTGAPGVYGSPEVESSRQAVNRFIRTSGIFDGIVDFEAATMDPATGMFRAEFQPSSTTGGPGDMIHPNRAGYQAMALAIDLNLIAPGAQQR
jgi:lysophospholipase L1-like esterase